MKECKFYRQTDGQTDGQMNGRTDRRQAIGKPHSSFRQDGIYKRKRNCRRIKHEKKRNLTIHKRSLTIFAANLRNRHKNVMTIQRESLTKWDV